MKPNSQKQPLRKGSSESQPSGSRGSGQARTNRPFQGTVVRHSELNDAEDQDDPISDVEVLESGPRHKSNPQVVVKPPQYQGTSFHRPPRPQSKREEMKRSSATHEVSPHFLPPAKTLRQKQELDDSHSGSDVTTSRPSARGSDQPNGISRTKNLSSKASNSLIDPDASLDELNFEDPSQHRATADMLLKRQKTANAASFKGAGRNKRNQSVDVDYSSDDALANDRSNMVPTTFVSTKKGKGNNAPRDERYDADLIFSEVDSWLVDEKHGSWSLIHNPVFKTLDLIGDGNMSVWTFPTAKIERIEYNSESKLIVIHKARDLTTGKGIHLYIKLPDREQSNDLTENLKASQPTIQLLKKDM